ncbi:trypco2 family protein [Dactylosporangium sp. NPDC049742]|uniref:trypco2 family protein n=1 Tax=Dactylosporangium sp. NPDC049742 TaxID=3154737 RepID=UPI003416FA56
MEIELADAVAAVREQLVQAAARGADQEITFTVGAIELEFAVELRADARAKAGFRAWVLTADADAGITRGRTHRVKVTLTPQGADQRPVAVAGGNGAAPTPPPGHIGRD